MANHLSRRNFLKNTSAGVAAAATVGVSITSAPQRAQASDDSPAPASWIHAGLQPGTAIFGGWTVATVSPVVHGAISVLLEDARSHEVLRVDVCRRSSGAPIGVEATDDFELIVMNAGDGRTRTRRDHHLAVRKLASTLAKAEGRGASPVGLVAHADRLDRHGAAALMVSPFTR